MNSLEELRAMFASLYKAQKFSPLPILPTCTYANDLESTVVDGTCDIERKALSFGNSVITGSAGGYVGYGEAIPATETYDSISFNSLSGVSVNGIIKNYRAADIEGPTNLLTYYGNAIIAYKKGPVCAIQRYQSEPGRSDTVCLPKTPEAQPNRNATPLESAELDAVLTQWLEKRHAMLRTVQ